MTYAQVMSFQDDLGRANLLAGTTCYETKVHFQAGLHESAHAVREAFQVSRAWFMGISHQRAMQNAYKSYFKTHRVYFFCVPLPLSLR